MIAFVLYSNFDKNTVKYHTVKVVVVVVVCIALTELYVRLFITFFLNTILDMKPDLINCKPVLKQRAGLYYTCALTVNRG